MAPNLARSHPQGDLWTVRYDGSMGFPKFYGYGDVYAFIFELEDFFMEEGIPITHAHTYFPYVLREKALLWYRVIAKRIPTEEGETKYERGIKELIYAFGSQEDEGKDVQYCGVQKAESASPQKDAIAVVPAAPVVQVIVKPAGISRKRKIVVQEPPAEIKKIRLADTTEENDAAKINENIANDREDNATAEGQKIENDTNMNAATGVEMITEETPHEVKAGQTNAEKVTSGEAATENLTTGNEKDETPTEVKASDISRINANAGNLRSTENGGKEATETATDKNVVNRSTPSIARKRHAVDAEELSQRKQFFPPVFLVMDGQPDSGFQWRRGTRKRATAVQRCRPARKRLRKFLGGLRK